MDSNTTTFDFNSTDPNSTFPYDFNGTTPPPGQWCPAVPDSVRSDLQMLLHYYLTPITCIIGLTTNILALVVFYLMKQETSAYFLLKFVAVLDSVNLIRDAVFPHVIHYPWCAYFMGHTWAPILVYTVTGSLSFVPFSIILLISIDRYAHVCRPLLTLSLNVHRMVRLLCGLVCGVILLAILALNVIRFHYLRGRAPKVYSSVVVSVLGILPFPVIAFFNILVIFGMRKAQRDVGIKGTAMILTMTLAFLLLKTPMTVMTIGNRFDVNLFSNSMVSFTLYLDTVNFSLNFWLYLATGKKFRRTLMRLLYKISPVSFGRTVRMSVSSSSSRKTSESRVEQLEMHAATGASRKASLPAPSVNVFT